jgi:hypothetical protein
MPLPAISAKVPPVRDRQDRIVRRKSSLWGGSPVHWQSEPSPAAFEVIPPAEACHWDGAMMPPSVSRGGSLPRREVPGCHFLEALCRWFKTKHMDRAFLLAHERRLFLSALHRIGHRNG